MHDDEISQLSNQQLSELLRQININVPITSSTRKICENRYRAFLFSKNSNKDTENSTPVSNGDYDEEETKNGINNEKNNVNNDEKTNKINNESTSDIKYNKQNDINSNNSHTSQSIEVNNTENNKNENNKTNGNHTEVDDSNFTTFYGVWTPLSYTTLKHETNNPMVFTSQNEALAMMKNYRGSRFKSFSSKEEAESFSTSNIGNLSVDKICSMVENLSPVTKPVIKAPTFQELMKFRKEIEENNIERVNTLVYTNPKYLISSGDMPVVIQEGSRLNAVHVAVKCNRLSILNLLLDTLQSKEFFQKMYPDADDDSLKFRRNHLNNLYLNTPEKILCDTPLHIACKFGFADIVRRLIDCEDIHLDSLNKDGKSCKQVICCRSKLRGEENQMLKKKISIILEEKAFIPLYDYVECTCKVGKPIVALSPKVFKSADRKIKAFVGPIPPEMAPKIYDRWRKSSRSKESSHIALSDFDRGMERLGRKIACQENVPFNEYWPFLECYTNLQSKSGLTKLELYLSNKSKNIVKNIKRQSLSAPKPPSTKRINKNDDEGVKKKLFVDDDNDNHNIQQENAMYGESLCNCGESLRSCDTCGTVDIDIRKMSVVFNLRSPPPPSNVSPDTILSHKMSRLKISDSPMKTSASMPTISDHVTRDAKQTELLVKSNSVRDIVEVTNEDIYIYGAFPSKIDIDVLRAIDDTPWITSNDYPHIFRWKCRIEKYSLAEMGSWPTPGTPRYKQKYFERSVLWTA